VTTSKSETCPRLKSPKGIIIAIDGPAGAGKSTVAKLVAERLRFLYLDTGAMYRALTLAAVKERANFLDKKRLIRIARRSKLKLKRKIGGTIDIYLNGRLVNQEIRKPLITSLVSFIARILEIRKIMVVQQRSISHKENCVVEGRDIGTVVFPDAFIKFYLDASLKTRGQRRYKELKQKRISSLARKEVQALIKQRDENDLNRRYAPLKKAADAIYVDTTNLTIKQVVSALVEEIKKRLSITQISKFVRYG
jgi:cytidylate kinase